jgi:hypothetical protein
MATEHIKIDDRTPRVSYTVGAVAQNSFEVPFAFFTDADLRVYVGGVLKALTTDYTVSGAGNSAGGSILLNSSVADTTVEIVRRVKIERTTDFPNSGPLKIDSLNTELDKQVAAMQQLADELGRSPRLPESEPAIDMTLPALADRAGKFWAWDAEGRPFAAAGTSGAATTPFMATVLDDPTALAARRTLGHRFLRLEDFGGGVHAADNTPALNALAADAPAQGIYSVLLDVGTYSFATKPNDFTVGLRFVGAGISLSGLKRNYSASSANEGFLTWTHAANGGGLEHVSVVAGAGTSNGSILSFRVPAPGQGASYGTLDNVYVSYDGGASYVRALYVDGVGNNLSGGQGLRDMRVTKCFFFDPGLAGYIVELRNAVNFFMNDTWINGRLLVSGGGTSLTNSNTVILTGVRTASDLFIENSVAVIATGMYVGGALFAQATTAGGMFQGKIATGLINVSSSFWVDDPDFSHSRSIGANGYCCRPDGLIEQWFIATGIPSGSHAIYNFPTSFPTACLAVHAQPVGNPQSIGVQSATTSSVELRADGDATTAYVRVLGY